MWTDHTEPFGIYEQIFGGGAGKLIVEIPGENLGPLMALSSGAVLLPW